MIKILIIKNLYKNIKIINMLMYLKFKTKLLYFFFILLNYFKIILDQNKKIKFNIF